MEHDNDVAVEEIARFRNEDPRRTVRLLRAGIVPAGKEGAIWVGSKRRLRAHHDELTSGKAA